jgi:aminoglycoside phosphotransferase (APT) family kinase protein
MTADDPGEELLRSRPALEAFLAREATAAGVEILECRRLSGGAIQENWLLRVRFEGGPRAGIENLVLRRDSATGVAVSRSRLEEFHLLKVAEAAGVSVPEPLWASDDEGILGRPFYVMKHCAGEAAGHLLVKAGRVADPDVLVERLGRELAKLHSIRPPRSDLAFLGALPDDPAGAAVARYRAHLDALGRPYPALEWGLRWCELRAPPPGDVVLLHQDFRTGNYLVEEGALTGILDWEFAAWGDPMSDIAWFCAKCWRFGRDDREAGGIGSREVFYRGYEAASGRRVEAERVAYWEVMAHLRWAVIALQQGHRFTAGGEASLDLALTGRVRPDELAFEALAMTPPKSWGGT